MKINVIPARQLTPEHAAAWAGLQEADPALASPYFRPEFTQAVASVRNDVEVAVLEEDGAPAGFFPFQRGRWGIGRAVGGPMSDFHGVIARRDLSWHAEDLVRACGLSAWSFDHLLAEQAPFRSFHYSTAPSPFMDLSRGFETYVAERQQAGTGKIREIKHHTRKAQREMGPIRFEIRNEPRAFASLVDWKTAQYRETGATCVFSFPWTVHLLECVLGYQGPGFAGQLEALYIGDQLAAVDLNLRSHGTLHGWFSAYCRDFARYSPGMILLLELARAAAAQGIRRIDLGKGPMPYKFSFMSGSTPVAEGSVAVVPLVSTLRRSWHGTRAWLRTSPLRLPVRVAGRLTRPIRGWLAFH
jgi:CelD/BcsL family acetyltransferase involved in cellulose biosynthesis